MNFTLTLKIIDNSFIRYIGMDSNEKCQSDVLTSLHTENMLSFLLWLQQRQLDVVTSLFFML